MAIDITPQGLANASACFNCLSAGQMEAVKVYLLAVKAGGSLDPQVLATAAACFSCLSPSQQMDVQTYLLGKLAGG